MKEVTFMSSVLELIVAGLTKVNVNSQQTSRRFCRMSDASEVMTLVTVSH